MEIVRARLLAPLLQTLMRGCVPRNQATETLLDKDCSKCPDKCVLLSVFANLSGLRCMLRLCAREQKQQFVDVATGSLGQGLGAACGMAYTGKYFDKAR